MSIAEALCKLEVRKDIPSIKLMKYDAGDSLHTQKRTTNMQQTCSKLVDYMNATALKTITRI